ncbi:hypothetical protein PTKIN_Ptkin03bG0092500 [Pterospermum kingtungense]
MAERLPVVAAQNIKSPSFSSFGSSPTSNDVGGRTKEGESRNENEWVEQDEPGVYITLTTLPGGAKDLNEFASVASGLVRNKLNNGGQRTEQEYTSNTMSA